MIVVALEALAGIAVSLSLLMAIAWVVQRRTGNSGWVDSIWTCSVGLTGAGSALWPIGGAPPNARQWLMAALVAIWSLRLGGHIAITTPKISGQPRDGDIARGAYRHTHRKDFGRPALCRLRQGLGPRCAAQNVLVSAKPGVRIDPAGICDFHRGEVSV